LAWSGTDIVDWMVVFEAATNVLPIVGGLLSVNREVYKDADSVGDVIIVATAATLAWRLDKESVIRAGISR